MAQGAFDSFVICAAMRTGSNFLEANLNALPDVQCLGEVFNPVFVGYPKQSELFGIDRSARDKNPTALLEKIQQQTSVLTGFRYFNDHDPRVFDAIMQNRRCAKIVLTRSPIESYVSLKIARETGQWKLTRLLKRKSARARFDLTEFLAHRQEVQKFYAAIRRVLQSTGQPAFHVDYEELQSLDVINGISCFLGLSSRLEQLDRSLKVQNPGGLKDKVENYSEMIAALGAIEADKLADPPDFEPPRPANVRNYVVAKKAPILFLPIKGAPKSAVCKWMAALDQVEVAALNKSWSQRDLRQWKRANTGCRSFTVLQHPVARAHRAFCRHILLEDGKHVFGPLRQTLEKSYGFHFPSDKKDLEQHRLVFAQFLDFLAANLAGQTSIRIDAAWCSQSRAVQGIGSFAPPDMVLREAELARELPALAARVGCTEIPDYTPDTSSAPFPLSQVYDADIEKKAQTAYRRDYMVFGFTDWA